MNASENDLTPYYLVTIDNSSGTLSRKLNWLDDDNETLSFVGKSFSILSESTYAELQLGDWSDGVFVVVQRIDPRGSAEALTMKQMQMACKALRLVRAPPGGDCEQDLLRLIVGAFLTRAELVAGMQRALQAASSITVSETGYVRYDGIVSTRVIDDEKPLYLCGNFATTTRPITDFFSTFSNPVEINDIEKPIDFDNPFYMSAYLQRSHSTRQYSEETTHASGYLQRSSLAIPYCYGELSSEIESKRNANNESNEPQWPSIDKNCDIKSCQTKSCFDGLEESTIGRIAQGLRNRNDGNK